MSENTSPAKAAVLGLLLLLFLVALTVYGPLCLALIENSVWGTNHVEDFFRTIALHDALSWIYRKTIPGF